MNMATSITSLFTGIPASADKFLTGISSVLLVQTAGRVILFDTGPYAYRPILQNRLKRLGIAPEMIDTVVLSHVHWDHAANADLFPAASIVIHARELAYADTPQEHDSSTPAYIGRALHKLRLTPVTGDTVITDGVHVVDLPVTRRVQSASWLVIPCSPATLLAAPESLSVARWTPQPKALQPKACSEQQQWPIRSTLGTIALSAFALIFPT